MADHPDRYTCGKTGKMYWKLAADGSRLAHPPQKPKAKVVIEKAAKAAPKKAKKK